MTTLFSFPRSENPTPNVRAARLITYICSKVARDTMGGALVKTAVSMPIILLVMTGIFSFSIALHQKLALAEAVAAGGRVLAVERGDTDPCQKTTDTIYAAAPTLSRSNMTISYVLNGVPVGSGVTSCPNTPNMIPKGSAQITATYPISVSIYGKSFGNLSLQTQLSEAIQ